MPLQTGSGKSAFSHNVAELIKAGHPQKQAVAIAYKKSGEDAQPGMGAGIMFLTPAGKTLFLRRKGADDPNAGRWCLPGGMGEDGETPEDTAVREAFEETGGIPHGPRYLVHRTKTPSGKDWNTFAQQVMDEFEPKLSDEHSEHAWASPDEPPEPLEAGTRAMIDHLSGAKHAADEHLAFDRSSARTTDANGYLHVASSHISKANVCGYLGREINLVMDGEPGWQPLEPEQMYQLLRDPEELKKAAPTFNNVPLLNTHMSATSKQFPKEAVIGSTGTDSEFKDPYLDNSLVIWNGKDIGDVEDETKKELSSAYRYRADMTPGTYQGQSYDGVMRDIVGNHVALVKEGRAGSDVVVGDSALPQLNEVFDMTTHVLSRKATLVQGVLAGYLLPKLAKDSKIELSPALVGVSSKNFKDKKASIVKSVTDLVKGKLATDAKIDDLPKVMDAMEDMPVEEGVDADPNSGLPMSAEEMRRKTMDADPVSAIEGMLKGKVDDATIAKVCEMLKGDRARDEETPEEKEARLKKAGDAEETEEQKVARVKKEGEDRKAHDALLVKTATDAAIKSQMAIREAEKEVKPYIGELAVAHDSAEAIYRTCLTAVGKYAADELKDLSLPALKAILKAVPKPNQRQNDELVLATDAAIADYNKLFPEASRIGHMG